MASSAQLGPAEVPSLRDALAQVKPKELKAVDLHMERCGGSASWSNLRDRHVEVTLFNIHSKDFKRV